MSLRSIKNEVQRHGFTWEKDILQKVYKATEEELKTIQYTHRTDLPKAYNRLDPCDISIKTTGRLNAVCMADCLRLYDAVADDNAFHLVVIHYLQDDERRMKRIQQIIELDLTKAVSSLFGTLTRGDIESLHTAVKSIPQRRKPTPEEHARIYTLRNTLQSNSGAIHLDIKCNRSQSRLQCSFNQFTTFLNNHSYRIVAKSDSNSFRGGEITPELPSGRRVFKKKAPESHLTPD